MCVRVLITGITGLIGSHLAKYALKQPSVEVHGFVRQSSSLRNIQAILNVVRLHDGDLCQPATLLAVIERTRPEWIFHMAAQQSVEASWQAPTDTLVTNSGGTCSLLNAVRVVMQRYKEYKPRILISSSAEVYGKQAETKRIDETHPFDPPNPYAASKVCDERMAILYGRAYCLDIIRARFFTMTGPGRRDQFFEGRKAREIVDRINGRAKGPIRLRNPTTFRTWCDARDGASACWQTLERGKPGEAYNIAGDCERTLGEVVDCMLRVANIRARLSLEQSLRWEEEAEPARVNDITRQQADVKKLKQATGWQPVIPVEACLDDLLQYYGLPANSDHGQ